eukprot:3278418-Amphidinium_carterae.1
MHLNSVLVKLGCSTTSSVFHVFACWAQAVVRAPQRYNLHTAPDHLAQGNTECNLTKNLRLGFLGKL